MENREAGRERGGRPPGDDSSDEDVAPALILTPEKQWELANWNSDANADWCRTREEKRVAADKKHKTVVDFLAMHGVPEREFVRIFLVPEEKRGQGPPRDGFNNDAMVVCEEVADKRRSYLCKYYTKQTSQTKGDMKGLLVGLEALEEAFKELVKKVKNAKGDPVDWPDAFKTNVSQVPHIKMSRPKKK